MNSSTSNEFLSNARIHQVSLVYTDMAESRHFYEKILGAKFLVQFDPPGLVFFDFCGTRLLLDKNGKPGLLYFRVTDIEHKFSTLQSRGLKFESEIQAVFKDDDGIFGNKGETEYMAFFNDPADNTLALVEQKP